MTQSLHRRSFINSILLFSLASLVSARRPQPVKGLVNYPQQVYKNIKPLSQDFVSVNGWVLPKETLIKGTR